MMGLRKLLFPKVRRLLAENTSTSEMQHRIMTIAHMVRSPLSNGSRSVLFSCISISSNHNALTHALNCSPRSS